MWGRPIESASPASRDGVLEVDVEAVLAQVRDDLPGPRHPLVLRPLTGGGDLPQVDPVPADVEVVGVLVHARHLDRRHQLDPKLLGGLRRLSHPGDRIVVGQRQRRNPGLGGFLDNLGGHQLPVGDRRMALKLNQHGRGA